MTIDPQLLRQFQEQTEHIRRVQGQIEPSQRALAETKEARRALDQAGMVPATQQRIRELERQGQLPTQQVRDLAQDLHARLKPLVTPEAIRNVQATLRPIPSNLIRTLNQQAQRQEQFRELSERLEQLNSEAEAAAQVEGIEPSDVAEGPNWLAQLSLSVRLHRLLPMAIATRSDVEDLIAAVQADNRPAVLIHAGVIVAAFIVAITTPAPPRS